MSGQTWLTVVGNLTADPDLRFTAGGDPVANFTVASTPRAFDKDTRDWKDGETLFMRCTAWRGMAENVAESLYRGARVVVFGRLVSRSFEDKEGQRRTVTELQVEEVGPALRYATAKVTRTPERNGGGGSGWAPNSSAGSDSRPAVSDSRAPANEDPWGGRADEPAF